jgi:hypothetical protein
MTELLFLPWRHLNRPERICVAALLALLASTRKGDDPFPWGWVIGWYGLAKLAEAADHTIWTATGGLVAGHALKHLLAAAAGVAALMPLWTGAARRLDAPP